LIPSISNNNLPLDTIEALTWGNELQLGYAKYPPIFPLFTEFFYFIFGNQDWSYYLLSQLFVVISFFIIFKFSENFFQNPIHSLLSILLLEGFYFYNFTTPELNAFLCQFPFLAGTVFYCWQAIKNNNNSSWLLLGIFSGLATLTYYLSLYLLASIFFYFTYNIIKYKKFNYKYLISLVSFFIVITPHLIWIADNNYTSINYALFRSFGDPLTRMQGSQFLNHIYYPLQFLIKQMVIFFPFFIMLFFLVTKVKVKINYKDKKLIFLFSIAILPLILMFFTSLVSGIRIRTMWLTTFYLFIGVFFIYLYSIKIDLKKLKAFLSLFLFLFIFSPTLYYFISDFKKNKRTDYPGNEIAKAVQSQWNKNFSNEIDIILGEGWLNGVWYGGNLSYHLKSRPKLKMELIINPNLGTVWVAGFGEINDCDGLMYQIKPFNDICMFGKK